MNHPNQLIKCFVTSLTADKELNLGEKNNLSAQDFSCSKTVNQMMLKNGTEKPRMFLSYRKTGLYPQNFVIWRFIYLSEFWKGKPIIQRWCKHLANFIMNSKVNMFCVCVCVCVCERERERYIWIHKKHETYADISISKINLSVEK